MDIFVEFDCYADIISVPDHLGCNISKYRNRFLDWIYDRKNDHGYWVKGTDGAGHTFYGLQYGIDAFVAYLNSHCCKAEHEKVSVKARDLDIADYDGQMVKIFF